MIAVFKIDYNGKNYCGWQRQNGQISVQQVVETATSTLLNRRVEIVGCGRTDSGVHAENFVCNFEIGIKDLDKLSKRALNSILPNDIAISKIYTSEDSFHSRFDAIQRSYVYRVNTEKSVFSKEFSYFAHYYNSMNFSEFEKFSSLLVNETNFRSFAKFHSSVENYNCKLSRAEWLSTDSCNAEFHISANRFLRGMVRLIVGTYFNLGLEKISLLQIESDIRSQNQISKAWSVPACGLTLHEVLYPEKAMETLVELSS